METRELLIDAFGRVRELVMKSTEDLRADALSHKLEPGANSIAWLVWHLTRTQDDHVSEIAGREQAWIEDDWVTRFGLPFPAEQTGFGHTPEQVAAVAPDDPELLQAYHQAVHDRTLAYLQTIDADELDRIIDESYDPPVAVGVRLVSVISDNLQHAGQARYVKGITERLGI